MPDIECQGVFVEELSVVASASHPTLKRKQWLKLADFKQQPLVLLNSGFATRRYIDDYCRTLEITPQIAMQANSISAVIEIIRHTQLATILPREVAMAQQGLRGATAPAVAAAHGGPAQSQGRLSQRGMPGVCRRGEWVANV